MDSSREIEGPHSSLELVRLLPLYARHPVIADANVLFQDTRRYLKTGVTVLTLLARYEVITLLTCEHVRSRLPEIMAERSVDPGPQQRVWREIYLPLVRFVRVPDAMCAGHPQVEAIADPEDRPFGRLAIAVAPSLLLTRDRHFSDVGLGTEQWADALTILGDLAELDAALYGSAHTSIMLARLAGLLARLAWRKIASEPWLSLATLGVGLLLFLTNKEEVVRRVRSIGAAIKEHGGRLLEAATPALERRERAESRLNSRLEKPMLPRSLESLCAHHLATRRLPVTTEMLLNACMTPGIEQSRAHLVRFLEAHPSFVETAGGTWELGELGMPVVEGTVTSSAAGR